MLELFEKEVNKETNNLYRKCFISDLLQGLVNCMIFLDYGICFYFTGLDIINNKLILGNPLNLYIETTVNNIKNIALMKESIKELMQLLETKSQINPFENRNDLVKLDKNNFEGKIEFKNVFFS